MNAPPRQPPPEALLPGRSCEWLQAALSGDATRCVDVLYEADGALALAFRRHGDRFDLRLIGRAQAPRTAVPAPDAALVPAAGARSEPPPDLLRWVARRLERVRERFRVPLLELFRDEAPREPYTFDTGLFHSRLGPLFVPGTTRYGAWVFVAERFDGQALAYEFESATGRIVLHLREGPGGADACLRTAHLSATLAVDERTPAERADPWAQVERYVGFLLSRCDGPTATYRRRPPSRRAFVDDRPSFAARLEGQFFVREVGHDYLNIYQAFWGLGGPADLLIHGDHECASMATHCPAPLHRPWATRLDVRPAASKAGTVSFTGLRDVDLIHGGEPRLRDALAEADRQAPGRLLVVMDTCVPQVIGDDIAAVVDEHRSTGRRPVALLSCRMEEHTPLRGPQAFWLSVLRQAADAPPAETPMAVNLIGYGPADGPEVRELGEALSAAGLPMNAVLFPGLTAGHARRFRSARLAVVNPWRYVQQAWGPIGAWAGLAAISPPLPVGPEGTRRWLEHVVRAATGQPPQTPCLPPPDVQDAWHTLSEKASEHEIAFVTLSTQLDLPVDPAETQGLPLLEALLEMGFRVALHVLDDEPRHAAAQRREPGPILDALVTRLGAGGRFRAAVWPGWRALEPTLRSPETALLYTEYHDDPRVRALGLQPIGPTDLRLGARGALGALRELIRRARDPFRRVHAPYLAERRAPR